MKTENTERLESPNFIKPIETKSKFGSSCKYIVLFLLKYIYTDYKSS